MNAVRQGALIPAIAVSGVLAACSPATPQTAPQPSATLHTPPTSQDASTWDALVRHDVANMQAQDRGRREGPEVSADLRDPCEVPTVYFGLGSADPSPEDKADLARVAQCFRDGPLRDSEVHLIGRADLTGDPSYNMALGLRRANHVKRELVRAGVPASRIRTTSRGTTAFVGPFEGYTYADDRRVDVILTH